MNREKLLKKYILAFAVQISSACIFWFLYLVRKHFKINLLAALVAAPFLLTSSLYLNKYSLAVMPMIISRYDTVEKYEQQNARLLMALILYTLSCIFMIWKFDSIFTRFLSSFLWRFNPFINLNNKRIEYLKNKPEGMNF